MRLNRNKGLRNRKARYTVSIYVVDEYFEHPNSDQLKLTLVKLFCGVVTAENERMAAAHCWIDIVGQYRLMRIGSFRVPDFIRNAMIDPQSVSNQLIRSSLSPEAGGFMLDNLVEAWLISVQKD